MDGLDQDDPATGKKWLLLSPSQNLEQNVPRTYWDCKSQPHEEVDSSRELRLREKGSADRVAGEKFIGEFAVGLGAWA
jgi:hypothetical protein